jgi:hypothetical protein
LIIGEYFLSRPSRGVQTLRRMLAPFTLVQLAVSDVGRECVAKLESVPRIWEGGGPRGQFSG